MTFFTKDTKTAFEARSEAMRISFGPVVFQSARVMRNSGILEILEKAGPAGLPMAEVVERVGLPPYGVRVLLESGLSIGLVTLAEGRFRITKTSHFLLHDELTRVNMDFVHDVCYRGF
ncbi:MAG: SAM-dependent methyltransferase, partial [Sphingobacteriaceae bacterium]|nr:SAM-dependent methyltransferase [Cytophagaceae bacterium]